MAAVCMLLLFSSACAQEQVEELLTKSDAERIYEFAEANESPIDSEKLAKGALHGEFPSFDEMLDMLKTAAKEPLAHAASALKTLLLPCLLAGIVSTLSAKGRSAPVLLLNMILTAGCMNICIDAVQRAHQCLITMVSFSDVIVPVFSVLTNVSGMNGTAALISPAAALAGTIGERVFAGYGIAICRVSICICAAAGISGEMLLRELAASLRKLMDWGIGLITAIFTALITLQSGVAAGMDSIAIRTTRYAVDSASAVIGSGVSDAWDAYVSGLSAAKAVIGIGGISAIAGVCLRPILYILCEMIALRIIVLLLGTSGSKEIKLAAEGFMGVCRMTMSAACASAAIWIILTAAFISSGRGIM